MLKNICNTHNHIFGSISYCFKLKIHTHSPILRRLSLITLYCKLFYHPLLELVEISEITSSTLSTLSLLRSRRQGQGLGNPRNFTQLESQSELNSLRTPPSPPRAHSTLPGLSVIEWKDWGVACKRSMEDTQAGTGRAKDTLDTLLCSSREQSKNRQEYWGAQRT